MSIIHIFNEEVTGRQGLEATGASCNKGYFSHGGGGFFHSKGPGDVPPARVYFFGLLV